ncbi:MAG: nuclear transport factor 2 family protein [Actinomycetota bacterium]
MTDAPTTDAVSVDGVVDVYFAAWNAAPTDRPLAVAEAFTPDAYYCDGAAEATGHDQIEAMMTGVFEQFEGASFALASPIDTHHRQARFAWRMSGPDGSTVVDGIDAIRFTDDGRISTALGFFGVGLPDPDAETS